MMRNGIGIPWDFVSPISLLQMTRISGKILYISNPVSKLLSLFPFRAVRDGTASAILPVVFFHAKGNDLPAFADPTVGSLRLQLFITKRAGKHCVMH